MAPDPTQERKQAHALIDMLPDEKLAAVRILLQGMVEPLSHSLASAPVDDEDITPDTAAALGLDRVTQLAQPFYIPPQGARRDAQPPSQFGARPVPPCLQE